MEGYIRDFTEKQGENLVNECGQAGGVGVLAHQATVYYKICNIVPSTCRSLHLIKKSKN